MTAKENERYGAWIDKGFHSCSYPHQLYMCSECEEEYLGFIGDYVYCPNCESYNVEVIYEKE